MPYWDHASATHPGWRFRVAPGTLCPAVLVPCFSLAGYEHFRPFLLVPCAIFTGYEQLRRRCLAIAPLFAAALSRHRSTPSHFVWPLCSYPQSWPQSVANVQKSDVRPFCWTDLTIRYMVMSSVLHRTHSVQFFLDSNFVVITQIFIKFFQKVLDRVELLQI